jgi:phosphoribosylformylglycinamidine synthase
VREEFQRYFDRADTFALGICNGCQMLAALKSVIPGTQLWPRFVRNVSEQYEARFPLVEMRAAPSVLFAGMAGSYLPVAVAHGEGHAQFDSPAAAQACARSGLIACRYVNHDGSIATTYPFNPSGSPLGIAALSNADGRVTIIMPHPERCFRYAQNSWRPEGAGEYSGWMRMFRNARQFCG